MNRGCSKFDADNPGVVGNTNLDMKAQKANSPVLVLFEYNRLKVFRYSFSETTPMLP